MPLCSVKGLISFNYMKTLVEKENKDKDAEKL